MSDIEIYPVHHFSQLIAHFQTGRGLDHASGNPKVLSTELPKDTSVLSDIK
ncbi:MAG: hypothetical protein H6765_05345 [Candidatus Peribacteria bacterium]|nr:MAG: hypothetical protein H6765_05345 [Candidatus Peribacteria bacterium]